MNAFVLTRRPELKMLLDLQLREILGVTPVTKDSVDDFQSLLNLVTDIHLVIVDPVLQEDIESLYKVLNGRNDIENTFVVKDDKSGIENLIAKLKSIFSSESSQSHQYISISIDSFIHFKLLPFDLYIKLGDEKYVKRIPAHEEIDAAALMALKGKGVTDLYFDRKFNKDFSVLLINNMLNKVQTTYTSDADKIKAASEVYLTTKEIVQSVGLPTRIIEVCQSVMDNITQEVVSRGKDKFSSYLTVMKSDSGLNFQYRFIEMTSFIATQLVEALDKKDTQAVKTIIFCSFFCDIALKDAEHLEYRSEEALKDMWPEDKESILIHAFKASEIVAKHKHAPAGADQIVLQHHGAVNGKGLPTVCEEAVVPMAKCLMASQELAFALLKNSDKKPSDVVSEVLKKFEGSPLDPYLKFFEATCRDMTE
jgi:hypothetical protein